MKIALFTAKSNIDNKMFGHTMSTDEKRPPTGIGYLYAILKQNGIDVDIYDRYCGDYRWRGNDFKDHTFAGIYCASICSNDIFDLINRLRTNTIAVGGPHASLFPEEFNKKVRYIVQGEAEQIITDLVSNQIAIHSFEDKIIKTKRLSSRELDLLPRFPYEYFWERKEHYTWTSPFETITPVFTLSTSRGCPYNCSFCSVKKIWGKVITSMSASRVLDDIKYVKSLGAKGIYFREDTFTSLKERLHEICEMMIRRRINLKWACETRVDAIDDETARLMSAAGCIGFYMGVESLSQHMLDVFNKKITVDQTLKCFELAHKYNIKTAASMIKGHSLETEFDRQETYRLLNIIKPTHIWWNQYRVEG